jgi:hypothetical protein
MNTDDARFDRLVDDELSEAQRRELLAGLDNEPGGWRRCALAFLESQCWKQTFAAVAQQGVADEPPSQAMPMRRSRWHGRLGTLLAMAASFLAVFWIGTHVQQTRIERPGVVGKVASTVGSRPTPAKSIQPDANLAGITPQTPPVADPWRTVTVAVPGSPALAGSPVRLPAVERDNIDPQWLGNLPPAMPEEVMRAFNRSGHQVEQHRELVPVALQDGRQLVMPVDQVEIHYTGNGTY